MQFPTLSTLLTLLLPTTLSLSLAAKPAYFILAGDSTTAVQSTGGGGWGNGFLSKTLLSPSTGINLGHNGATTASFRSGGDWAKVLSNIASHKSSSTVYVTIQFGHNDQKTTSGVSLAQYSTNLGVFVNDVVSTGGVPILVTPLTRRSFSGSKVKEDLAPQRDATISVANSKGARFIDLNSASVAYVNAIGADAAHKYNLNADDNTHLNAWGSVVFGRLVSDLLVAKYSDIKTVTVANATLSKQLKDGVAA